MKRRDLFKMLATLAAVPFVAPLVAMCKPKRDAAYMECAKPLFAQRDPVISGHVMAIGTEVPRYFYIRSEEPSEGEKQLGIVEKRIYGSSL